MTPFSWKFQIENRPGQQARVGERKAFTLVEMLVSMVILGFIIFITVQLSGVTSGVISQQTKEMNTLDAANAVFQQIGLDISRMVMRDDVDYSFIKNAAGTTGNLPGNDVLSFYARTTGLSSTGAPSTGTPRPLSVVEYQVAQNAANNNLLELDYGALQINWDNSGTYQQFEVSTNQLLTTTTTTSNTLPAVPSTSFTELAPEVIRMEICFVLVNDPVTTDSPPKLLTPTVPAYISSTNVPLPIRNLAGIIVGIVVVAPPSRLLLPSGTDVRVAQLFPDAVANEDLLSLWTPIVDDTAKLEGAGVPAQAIVGIQVYQKYFPLPNSTP